jgi:hypothetical protein
LRQWAKKHPQVKILEGSLQEKLPQLEEFDAIFLGGYVPAISEESVQSDQVMKQAQKAKKSLLSAFEEFKDLKFSDAEIHEFSQTALDKPGVTLDQVEEFLEKLTRQKNITTQQKESCLNALHKNFPKGAPESIEQQAWQLGNPLILFIQYCLDNHMRPGASLSMRLLTTDSPKKNPEFAKNILGRKDITYNEKIVPVTIPADCPYFQGKEALVFVIKKK